MKLFKTFRMAVPALILVLLTGCGSGEPESTGGLSMGMSVDDSGEGVVVDDIRARPAAEGMNSAAYFTIRNYETERNRLLGVSSDVASMVQVHESYAEENGMAGMRDAGVPEIDGRSVLQFQPGGLHVMLMQLNRDLQPGDTFDLTLRFEKGDDVTVTVQVLEN